MVDAGVSGRNDPHVVASHGDISHTVTHLQRGDNDIQEWDVEVLNHVLANVLDEDRVEASATDDFTVFVIENEIDDVCLLLTVSRQKIMDDDVFDQ